MTTTATTMSCQELMAESTRTSSAMGATTTDLVMLTIDNSQSGQQHLTVGFSFMQSVKECHGLIPRNWVLLDNQSTINVFCNSSLLHNICKAATPLDIHCKLGTTMTEMEGDLSGYRTVWYHPNVVANTLSLSQV